LEDAVLFIGDTAPNQLGKSHKRGKTMEYTVLEQDSSWTVIQILHPLSYI
jgi:hypothetical protein